jgi:uncharacterized protein YjbJ (UPF0337 family)
MLTREELKGSWTQLKGQIRERWGQITDDELQQLQGDGEQLVGYLQKKTGQSRQELERFLQDAVHGGESMWQRGREFVQQTAKDAQDGLQDSYTAAERQLERGYDEARRMVRTRPLESLTTAFGVGLMTGIVASLLLGGRRA